MNFLLLLRTFVTTAIYNFDQSHFKEKDSSKLRLLDRENNQLLKAPDKILLAWCIPICVVQLQNIRKVFSSIDRQLECEGRFHSSGKNS
jgi:hypothetical protein